VYERIFNTQKLDPSLVDESYREFYSSLKPFVPKYYGAQWSKIDKERLEMRLENLLYIGKLNP
jgi:hypothetical protein